MKLSSKRKELLFKAIDDPIMQLRMSITRNNLNSDDIDYLLFKLSLQIHEQVKKELSIQ